MQLYSGLSAILDLDNVAWKGFKKVMNKNKISNVKELLYDATNDEVKRAIIQMQDQEILYVYSYNYNWDKGFDIPQSVLDNEKFFIELMDQGI